MTKLFLVLFFVVSSSASYAQVYYGSASKAVGDSGRGAIRPGDQVFMNVAGLVHIGGRHLTSSFTNQEVAVGLSDNTSESSLPAAVGFWKTAEVINGQEIRREDFRIGLAEFMGPTVSVGLLGHQYSYIQPDKVERAVNAEAGIIWAPKEYIGLGIVAYDFLQNSKKEVVTNIPFSPKTGIGVNFLLRRQAMLRADILSGPGNTFGKSKISVGYEGFWNRWTAFRLGYSRDQLIGSSMGTIGLGLDLPRFQIQYAYQGDTSESGNYRHSIDLGIPF